MAEFVPDCPSSKVNVKMAGHISSGSEGAVDVKWQGLCRTL